MAVERSYQTAIEAEVEEAIALAETARSRGNDPHPSVEIPVAQDMADRVENLLDIDGIADRIRELEGEMSREHAALHLAEGFATGELGDIADPSDRIEAAVRTAVALLTEGVVAAPIEGIDGVDVEDAADGTSFVRITYAGPIRSAGGTAQALSVLVADYTRSLLGIEAYRPAELEVGRVVEEVQLYERETGLQYTPSREETAHIAEHCPIMLDGEPTTEDELDSYRDMDRIDTNRGRGGMCLVLAEGIAQKADKLARYVDAIDAVDWPWLATLRAGAGKHSDADDESATKSVGPKDDYLVDLIAGRPVVAHPSRPGGFRLRYGRARNHGLATAGVHPATMHLLDDFLAPGTQLKTERPGKAAGVVPVDTIEGPTVRLHDGSIRRLDDPETAAELRSGVAEILDVGEYLVNVGEFVENNHPLLPGAYDISRWCLEMTNAGADIQAIEDDPDVSLTDPGPEQAVGWAQRHEAPLHPRYTYLYHDASIEAIETLAAAIEAGTRANDGLHLRADDAIEAVLGTLLVPHEVDGDDLVIEAWLPLARTLGFDGGLQREWETLSGEDPLDAVNEIAPFPVRAKAPTRVGARMGRPEKSEARELSPAVHCLFPVGAAGGDQRSLAEAASYRPDANGNAGEIEVQLNRRRCVSCGEEGVDPRCPACGEATTPVYVCRECDIEVEPDEAGRTECPRCGREATCVTQQSLDVAARFDAAFDSVEVPKRHVPIVKGVKGLTSETKAPEPLEKGVLRAAHDISVFKDGTSRYDMTDLPVTAVRPAEVGVDAETFRELGYEVDVDGEALEYDDQVVELRNQDVILSEDAAEYLFHTSQFVDDLLTDYYELEPFYELEGPEDLVGELVLGLAPHTSAAVTGRVVGFTSAAVGYAHPFFHAAKRRNCFHPETKMWVQTEEDEWIHTPIGDLVEERLEDPREDAVGTLIQSVDDLSVQSLDGTGSPVVRPINELTKHPAPTHLLRIETRSGRHMTVTPDHSFRRWTPSGLETVEATSLSTGDRLPTPKSIEFDGSTDTIDLLAAFIEAESIPNDSLVVRGLGREQIRDLLDDATSADDFLTPFADAVGFSKKTVHNWISRDSIPVGPLLERYPSSELLDRLPEDIELAAKRDTTTVPRFLEIDEPVARLLGYYSAEGYTRFEPGSFYQTAICSSNQELRAELTDTLEEALGVTGYEVDERAVMVSGRLVWCLFTEILNLGQNAHSKRIPDRIMAAPRQHLRAYLAAYFSGDGSTSSDRYDIRAHTVSDELIIDLTAALKRFGISSKIYQESRHITSGPVAEFYDDRDDQPEFTTWVLKLSSENVARFASEIGFHLDHKQTALDGVLDSVELRSQRLFSDGGEIWLDEISDIEIVESDIDHTYCLNVDETHTLVANDLVASQCDGDEDCVMLLMDGLLNFSRSYLPSNRGGRMDAPLVLSTRIDPAEIDDEAHNIETVSSYPLELYEAADDYGMPDAIDIELAGDAIGPDTTPRFRHTDDPSDIAAGPDLSAYKTLESMEEKLTAQLELARKLRAVDESDVAERVIEGHYLPDLLGNLRAFSSQEMRCRDCGKKYRRAPLTGSCTECGGTVSLTVYEGMVNKYLEPAIDIAEQYDVRAYTRQRLEVLELTLESLFEDDTDKQAGIADFM